MSMSQDAGANGLDGAPEREALRLSDIVVVIKLKSYDIELRRKSSRAYLHVCTPGQLSEREREK